MLKPEMKAALITDEVIRIESVVKPAISARQILIKVSACGVNRADLFQVDGLYPAPNGMANIPGLEVAGVVVEVGKNVAHYRVGDKVCALIAGCGYAQYVAVDAALALIIPDNLSFVEAAALPEALSTIYFNLFMKAKMKPGQTLLLYGAASGIGSIAIQVAKYCGISIIAVASSEEKCRFSTELGASLAINYHTQDIAHQVKSFTNNLGVSVVLDMFGGQYVPISLSCLKTYGTMIIIALLKGAKQELNLAPILFKNLTIMGSTLRSQPLATKKKIIHNICTKLWSQVAQGQIKPVIDRTFSFDLVSEAHDYMRENQHKGKIVLTL